MTAGYHHVRRNLSVCAIALLAVSLAPVGVEAEPQSKTKTTKPAASNPTLLECYKQAGMTYDPATKRWTMYSEEMVGIVRQDFLANAWLAQQEFQEARFAFVRHYPNDTAESHSADELHENRTNQADGTARISLRGRPPRESREHRRCSTRREGSFV